MKGERGYIVKIRFLKYPSEGGEPSIGKKDYYYFMCEKLRNKVIDEVCRSNADTIAQLPIKITNNKGYNYNSGKCIIIGSAFIDDELWKFIDLEKSTFYREIVKIEPAEVPRYNAFSVEANRLCALEHFIDKDAIFSNLFLEGAMPKQKPADNEMKLTDVEIAASTSTSVNSISESSRYDEITTNSCGGPDYAYKLTPISKDTVNWCNYGTSITTNTTSPIGISLNTSKLAGNKIEKKEDKSMFENMAKDIKFGPATDVKFSIYGPAFNGGDKWLARHEGEWVDVSDMLIDASSFCYMMPVAKSMVKEGDFILHKGKWARVECAVEEDNYICVEKINEQEVVQILPTKNMFGFDYYTKLICPIEGFEGAEGFGATTDNPFGMLPFIMAMKDGKKDNLLPLMLMSGKMDMSNPMMLMMLGGDNSNLGLMMAMMAMGKKG